MVTFAYSPLLPTLENGAPSIRLVELEPASDKTVPVSARLLDAHLDKNLIYEALSYCWGDANVRLPITLNGLGFEVTTNLHAALVHLRKTTEARTLWIDAICVNQKDIDERNNQVQLMRKIYQGTKCGVIWLGEIPEGGELAVETFRDLCTLAGRPEISADDKFSGERILKRIMYDKTSTNSFRKFANQAWFHRVWTIQECALPRRLEMAWGDEVLDWDKLHRVFNQTLPSNPPATSIAYPFIYKGDLRRSIQQGQLWSETDLLIMFRGKSATDKKDHVFATIGLFPETKDSNFGFSRQRKADYHMALTRVYTTAMRRLLAKEQKLGLLKFAIPRSEEGKPDIPEVELIPSWVIDWSTKTPNLIGGHHTWGMFSSAGKSPYTHFDYKSVLNRLTVSGAKIDRIQNLSRPLLVHGGKMIELQSWLNFIKESTALPPHELLKVFYEVIMAGMMPENDGRFKLRRFKPILEDIETAARSTQLLAEFGLLDADVMKSEDYRPCIHLVANCKDRKIAITERGRLGLVPDNAKIGDSIYLFMGGDVPFILCPAEESTWSLIGHCYIHGIMDGEVFDETKCERMVLV